MSIDVMAASGKQEFPDMFELSAGDHSSSAFGSDVFGTPMAAKKPKALGSEWVDFGGASGAKDTRLVLKEEKEDIQKKDANKTRQVPRLRRCQTDSSATAQTSHHKRTHRGTISGGEEINKNSGRERKSRSTKRPPSRTTSAGGKPSRTASAKRSPPRRTTSASGTATFPKRSPPRRTTSASATLKESSDPSDLSRIRSSGYLKKGCGTSVASAPTNTRPRPSPPRRTTSASGTSTLNDRSDISDLSRIRSSGHLRKGCGTSVASTPAATRRLLGRSTSANCTRSDRGERSLSPSRIASSRKDTGNASSDPEIFTLLNEENDEDVDFGKKKLRRRPLSRSFDKASRSSSNPSLLSKPKMASRAKSSGERGKHPAGRRTSPRPSRSSSSPSLFGKPQMARRAKSSRGHRTSSPADWTKKRASSPNVSTPERSSSPGTEPQKKRASCPTTFDDDSSSDEESLGDMAEKTVENNATKDVTEDKNKDENAKKGSAEEPAKTSMSLEEIYEREMEIDTRELDKSAKNADHEDREKNGESSRPQTTDTKQKAQNRTSSSSPTSQHDKSNKRDHSKNSRSRRGIASSRSLTKGPPTRECSRSPSRLSKIDKPHKKDTERSKRGKSSTRELSRRGPSSMREVMSVELSKSSGGSTEEPSAPARELIRSPGSSREVSKSPTRELKKGAGSSREIGRSPSRGLARSHASSRDVSKRSGLQKAHSLDQSKGGTSPVRRTPRRTISEKASRAPRRGLGPRTTPSRSPTRSTSHRSLSRRMKDESGLVKDGSPASSPFGRSKTCGHLEPKSARRLRKDDIDLGDQDDKNTADEESLKNPTNQTRGPPMRRTLSGPAPRGAYRARTTLGNIQQRQLLGGLETTDHQKDEHESEDEAQLEKASSWNKEAKNAFPEEEIGDLFAASTWHNNRATAADPSFSPIGVRKLAAVTSVFAGTAKKAADIFGLSASIHGSSPSSPTPEQGKNNRKFRTSILGGKGKTIQGPAVLTLGDGDDLDSSSEEFS